MQEVDSKDTRTELAELRAHFIQHRARFNKLLDRAWWLFTVAIGGLGAAIVKLIMITRVFTAVEQQAAHSAARIQLLEQVIFLRSEPAVTPERAEP